MARKRKAGAAKQATPARKAAAPARPDSTGRVPQPNDRRARFRDQATTKRKTRKD